MPIHMSKAAFSKQAGLHLLLRHCVPLSNMPCPACLTSDYSTVQGRPGGIASGCWSISWPVEPRDLFRRTLKNTAKGLQIRTTISGIVIVVGELVSSQRHSAFKNQGLRNRPGSSCLGRWVANVSAPPLHLATGQRWWPWWPQSWWTEQRLLDCEQ